MCRSSAVKRGSTLFLFWLGAVLCAATAPDQSIQDSRYLAPGDFLNGPASFYGELSLADGKTRCLLVQSAWGRYTYRLHTVATTPESLPSVPDVLPRMEPAPRSRTLDWRKIENGKLWLEGEIHYCRSKGTEMGGRFTFQNGLVELRLELIGFESAGPSPEPTHRNIRYGPHFRQSLDVYLAESDQPTPVAVYVHGGSWTGLDKSELRQFQPLLAAGISVVSVNYRYCPPQNPSPEVPAVAIPLRDAARAVQFIRSRAAEWNMDPDRLGLWGESAGGCTVLWLATHPDLAEPAAPDPIVRLSTRPRCIAALIPQTTLDPRQMRDWVGPELTYGPHAFGIGSDGSGKARFERFLDSREALLPWITEYSPATLLRRDGPPIFLDYGERSLEPRPTDRGYFTHSPRFGTGFFALARQLGRECYLKYQGHEAERYPTWTAFMIARLQE